MFPTYLTSKLLSMFFGVFVLQPFCDGSNAVVKTDQNEIHQNFLKQAKAKWEKQIDSIDPYSIICHLERKNEGLPHDQGGTEEIHAKRLGPLVLVETLIEGSKKKRAWGINPDYYFQVEAIDSRHWQLGAIGEIADEPSNIVMQKLTNRVFQPDFMHLMIGGGMRLTDIPWENSAAVKLVAAKVVEDFSVHCIVELEFKFDFDDSVKTIAGHPGHAIKSAKFVFETTDWKPLSAIVDYDSGPQGQQITFTHNNEFDLNGRLSSRIDRMVFKGTDIISVVTIDQFEEAPIPHSSEFRLPHYGLPEYKESPKSWIRVILYLTVVLVAVAIILTNRIWVRS